MNRRFSPALVTILVLVGTLGLSSSPSEGKEISPDDICAARGGEWRGGRCISPDEIESNRRKTEQAKRECSKKSGWKWHLILGQCVETAEGRLRRLAEEERQRQRQAADSACKSVGMILGSNGTCYERPRPQASFQRTTKPQEKVLTEPQEKVFIVEISPSKSYHITYQTSDCSLISWGQYINGDYSTVYSEGRYKPCVDCSDRHDEFKVVIAPRIRGRCQS